MSELSESQLQEIVQQVVERTMGEGGLDKPAEAAGSPADAQALTASPAGDLTNKTRRIAIAADHGGFSMKEDLKPYLQKTAGLTAVNPWITRILPMQLH